MNGRRQLIVLCAFSAVLCSNAQYAQLDPSYGPEGIVFSQPGPGFGEAAYGVCIDAADRILQFGQLKTAPNEFNAMIRRWHPNGEPDMTYGTNGRLLLPGRVVQTGTRLPSGKILAFSAAVTNVYERKLLRLGLDGLPDPSFGVDGFLPVPFPVDGYDLPMTTTRNGKVAYGFTHSTRFYLLLLNEDGSLDTTFADNGIFLSPEGMTFFTTCISEDLEGRFLVGGTFNTGQGVSSAVMRVTADGNLDQSFGENGFTAYGMFGTTAHQVVRAILVEPNGNLLIGGGRTYTNSGMTFTLARLLPNGSLDASVPNNGLPMEPFATDTKRLHILGLSYDIYGRIIAFGELRPDSGPAAEKRPTWASFQNDLRPDPDFGDQGLLRLQGAMSMFGYANIGQLSTGDLVASTYFALPPTYGHATGLSRLSTSLTTAVDAIPNEGILTAYPNPAVDHIMVGSPTNVSGKVVHSLSDMTGRIVASYAWTRDSGESAIQLQLPEHISNGAYFLVQRSDQGQRTVRIVVER